MQFLTGFTLCLTAMVTVTGAVPVADAAAPVSDIANAGLQPECADDATTHFCIQPSVKGYCSGDNWITGYAQCDRPNCWCSTV